MDTIAPVRDLRRSPLAHRLAFRLRQFLPLFLLSSVFGCRASCDLVEAELRAKEEQLAQLKCALDRRECDIRGLEMQIDQLQRQLSHPGGPIISTGLEVKEIALGRLTGGYDENPACYGDEGLQVLLEPRDCDNQSIKAHGCLRLEVYEITQQGLKVPLSTWDIDDRELRRTWDTPIFGSPAFRLQFPWKNLPASERLRVVARFTTSDGQRFEADKDVTIRVGQAQVRHHVIPAVPPPPEPPRSPSAPVERMVPPSPILSRPSEVPPPSVSAPSRPAPPVGLAPPPAAAAQRPVTQTSWSPPREQPMPNEAPCDHRAVGIKAPLNARRSP